jgi:hypothetical protein
MALDHRRASAGCCAGAGLAGVLSAVRRQERPQLKSYGPTLHAPQRWRCWAGLDAQFAAIMNVDVVDQYRGIGSTDFWGISFAFSSIDALEA